jgi:predicted ATPase
MYYFDHFKGFTHAELDLSKPLTILIGANGSGKSNLIEAIEVLSFIAQGGRLYDITELGRGGQLEIRGGLASCVQYGHNAFSLGIRTQTYSYCVKVQTKPMPKIVQEYLFVDSEMIFETILENHDSKKDKILVKYQDFTLQSKKPQEYVSAQKSVLSQCHHFFDKKQFSPIGLQTKILNSPFIFDPIPKMMRQYEQISSYRLAKNGANLSSVLFNLNASQKDREILDRMLNWIKQLPNEPYQAFDFDVTKHDSVMFGLKEEKHDKPVGANLLSDGTLRSLAILIALETVKQDSSPSFIVIEEFDNGLHPSRIEALIKAILDCCQRQNLTVLVTTHNPATLNALPPAQLEGVVLCTGDKLVKLNDLPRYPELLERGKLGELVTQRVIEQYLAPDFEKERQREAFQWLKNLP